VNNHGINRNLHSVPLAIMFVLERVPPRRQWPNQRSCGWPSQHKRGNWWTWPGSNRLAKTRKKIYLIGSLGFVLCC